MTGRVARTHRPGQATDPEGWKRVDAVLDGALDRDPANWPAYLEQACGGDLALRREVESLLERVEAARALLASPPPGRPPGLPPPPPCPG